MNKTTKLVLKNGPYSKANGNFVIVAYDTWTVIKDGFLTREAAQEFLAFEETLKRS